MAYSTKEGRWGGGGWSGCEKGEGGEEKQAED